MMSPLWKSAVRPSRQEVQMYPNTLSLLEQPIELFRTSDWMVVL